MHKFVIYHYETTLILSGMTVALPLAVKSFLKETKTQEESPNNSKSQFTNFITREEETHCLLLKGRKTQSNELFLNQVIMVK